MDRKLLAEMWETTEGGEMPAAFVKVVESYLRRKSVFAPQPFTESDYAVCVALFKMMEKSFAKKE